MIAATTLNLQNTDEKERK